MNECSRRFGLKPQKAHKDLATKRHIRHKKDLKKGKGNEGSIVDARVVGEL